MRRVSLLALVLVAVSVAGWSACAQSTYPMVLFFHQEGCPDCEIIRAALDDMETAHPELEVGSYEITQPGNLDLLDELASRFGVTRLTVPIVFVGQDTIVIGAELAERLELRAAIETCLEQECRSLLETPTSNGLIADLWVLAVITAVFSLLYLLQGR